MAKVNLRKLAALLTIKEGLKEQISIAQAQEVLGCLATHWREVDVETFTRELAALLDRGGKRSAHGSRR